MRRFALPRAALWLLVKAYPLVVCIIHVWNKYSLINCPTGATGKLNNKVNEIYKRSMTLSQEDGWILHSKRFHPYL